MTNQKRILAAGLLVIGLCAVPLQAVDAAENTSRDDIIQALNLVPMNDGACIGYYKEMYESTVQTATEKQRPAASGIYYLMSGGLFDPWHRFDGDEILVYHAGAPMNQMLIYPDGTFKTFVLGPDPTLGQQPQMIIPAGAWMGFRIADDDPGAWGLYSVFCAPGFSLDAITMTNAAALGAQYPDAVETMKNLRMYE